MIDFQTYYHTKCVNTVMRRTRVTKSGEAQQYGEPHSLISGGRPSPTGSLRLCTADEAFTWVVGRQPSFT